MLIKEQLKKYALSQDFIKALNIPKNAELDFKLIGQGEYNINYAFRHPTSGEKLVLRLNTGSQMHLEHQINYEYEALKILETSGRTPRAFYVDGSKKYIEFGALVMQYLPGKALDYKNNTAIAAACLADIHCTKIPNNTHLIKPKNPLQAILNECEEMAEVYYNCKNADGFVLEKIKNMINAAKKLSLECSLDNNCLINTELNSGNFLINSEEIGSYLIDWEKPIIGEAAQDIAHFIAPTTTFWKTDFIFTQQGKIDFIDEYIIKIAGRISTENLYNRVKIYETITCLRGITWCAMAWVQYQQSDRLIKNESTYKKIKNYLSEIFLKSIENNYFAF